MCACTGLEAGEHAAEERRWREAVHLKLAAISAQLTASTLIIKALAERSGVRLPKEAEAALSSATGGLEAAGELAAETAIATDPLGKGNGNGAHEEAHHSSIFIGLNALTLALRVGLVALAATIAVTVPNFGFLVALMGAVTTMLVSFILPALFYAIVHWEGLGMGDLWLCGGIVMLGLLGMGIGLYNTLVVGI